jgi:hypothetical protein
MAPAAFCATTHETLYNTAREDKVDLTELFAMFFESHSNLFNVGFVF